jgi:hypothetical protein
VEQPQGLLSHESETLEAKFDGQQTEFLDALIAHAKEVYRSSFCLLALLPAELTAAPDDNLGHPVVVVYYSRSAYMCPRAREFPYVLSILVPHQERESLLWEG